MFLLPILILFPILFLIPFPILLAMLLPFMSAPAARRLRVGRARLRLSLPPQQRRRWRVRE